MWYPGFYDGGSVIVDYTIAYGKVTGSYSETITKVLTPPYTVTGLETGATYKFKVLAWNKFAPSLYSTEVTELAA